MATVASENPGIAMLHGHVRLPAGVSNRGPGKREDADGIELAGIAVIATDGLRTLSVDADTDGRFAIHLPAGVYTLSASTGPWAAIRTDIAARTDADREVDLTLATGATISGRLRGAPNGPTSVGVRYADARPTTSPIAGANIDENHAFTVSGLIPGRRYDLTIVGRGIRTTRVAGVMAPASGLDLATEPRGILRGTIGVATGQTCPIHTVTLVVAPPGTSIEVDPSAGRIRSTGHPDGACVFELTAPEEPTHAMIIAIGRGWYLEEPVDIPASGDPRPVCLNPPCANPSEVAADVVVEISGLGDEVEGVLVCLTPAAGDPDDDTCLADQRGHYVFPRLRIGTTLIVRAEGGPCVPDQRTVTVRRGDNLVELACHRPIGAGHDS